MIYTEYSFKNVFQYKEGDVYWCTADIGWITGHCYISLWTSCTQEQQLVMFEGVPTHIRMHGRFLENNVEENKVNIFYTAPTAIRALEAKWNGDLYTPYVIIYHL